LAKILWIEDNAGKFRTGSEVSAYKNRENRE